MPYKSDKISINNPKLDRRVKVTPEMKREILALFKSKTPIRAIARLFPQISRRTIQFICHPELLERQVAQWRLNHSWKEYYTTEKNRIYQKNHRQYKYQLFKEGKLGKYRKIPISGCVFKYKSTN